MTQTTKSTCRNVCWILGIIGGIVAFLLLKGAMAMLLAFVLAVVVALCLGFLLVKIFCAKGEAAATPATATQAAPMAKATPAPEAPAPEAASEPEVEAAPEAEVEPAPEAAPAPETAPETAPVMAPVADVPTAPDDLKKLKGVGPKIEEKLHEAGVTTFAQIAAWDAEDVAKMDDLLAFKGRIDRDGWVAQAKTLAAGGLTDFAKRVDDGDVY